MSYDIKDMYGLGITTPIASFFMSPREREELYGDESSRREIVRVYTLTDTGRKVVTRDAGSTSSDEMRVLNYLRDNKSATDDQLDVVAERWVVRSLKEHGLVKELTA